MTTKRVQIFLTPEQRRRLEDEARRQKRSIASLVREAVDARFGGFSPKERLAAVDAIEAMRGGRYLTPDQINGVVDDKPEHGT